jgi:peptide/nickel transport system substrate-binding protein
MTSVRRLPLVMVTVVVVLALLSTACQRSETDSGKPGTSGKGGKLVFGLPQEPDVLDPHTTALAVASRVMLNIYDPLVWKDNAGEYHPGLARSWEISPDGLTYTFKLRDDVKFHDGTPFNAEAVKVNFDRVINPATKAKGARSNIGPYKATEVVDQYTARVILAEPFAPFLDSLSQPTLSIISPAAITKYGDDLGQHPVGTGPFKFVEWVQKDHVRLARNDDYKWAPGIRKHQGPAHLASIEFKFILESAARMATLETGETNIVEAVTAQDLPRLESNSKIKFVKAPWGGMVLNAMLNAKKFPTDDVRVRRAMLAAHDQDTIVSTLFKGIHTPARGPLPPTQWGAGKLGEEYKFDLARAKKLLDDAGWKPGPDGIRVKNGKVLKVLMITQPGTKMEGAAEMIQAQQREAGILIEISDRDRAAGYAAYSVGEHNLAPIFLSASDPHVLSMAFHSRNIGAGFNRAHYANPELDKALNDGAATTDPAKRLERYAKAQKIIMDEAIMLPIYNQVAVYALRGEVEDVTYEPRAYPVLYDVYMALK